jgi:hypothetical protein
LGPWWLHFHIAAIFKTNCSIAILGCARPVLFPFNPFPKNPFVLLGEKSLSFVRLPL